MVPARGPGGHRRPSHRASLRLDHLLRAYGPIDGFGGPRDPAPADLTDVIRLGLLLNPGLSLRPNLRGMSETRSRNLLRGGKLHCGWLLYWGGTLGFNLPSRGQLHGHGLRDSLLMVGHVPAASRRGCRVLLSVERFPFRRAALASLFARRPLNGCLFDFRLLIY